jgi:hypothetical protein
MPPCARTTFRAKSRERAPGAAGGAAPRWTAYPTHPRRVALPEMRVRQLRLRGRARVDGPVRPGAGDRRGRARGADDPPVMDVVVLLIGLDAQAVALLLTRARDDPPRPRPRHGRARRARAGRGRPGIHGARAPPARRRRWSSSARRAGWGGRGWVRHRSGSLPCCWARWGPRGARRGWVGRRADKRAAGPAERAQRGLGAGLLRAPPVRGDLPPGRQTACRHATCHRRASYRKPEASYRQATGQATGWI